MNFNGIDVSRWQGQINWAKVKASGIQYAIIKCGGSDDGMYTDKCFEYNYQNARANGIKVGVYYFVNDKFKTFDEAVNQAKHCLRILDGKELDLPVYVDIEAKELSGHQQEVTEAALAFMATIGNEGGYRYGVYGSDISGFKDRMKYDIFLLNPEISIWCARYGSEPKYATKWDIWQSSSSGTVPGINGRVDTDVVKPKAFNQEPVVGTFVPEPAPITTSEAVQVVEKNMTKELAHNIYELIKEYL